MVFNEFAGVEDVNDGCVDGEFVAAEVHMLPDGHVAHLF